MMQGLKMVFDSGFACAVTASVAFSNKAYPKQVGLQGTGNGPMAALSTPAWVESWFSV
jgi:hypothetical protein